MKGVARGRPSGLPQSHLWCQALAMTDPCGRTLLRNNRNKLLQNVQLNDWME